MGLSCVGGGGRAEEVGTLLCNNTRVSLFKKNWGDRTKNILVASSSGSAFADMHAN